MTTISNSDAQQGYSYIKVTEWSSDSQIRQDINLPKDFDPNKLLSFSYWAKFEDINDFRSGMFTSRNELHARLKLEYQNGQGETKVVHMMSHRACMIPG